jgi:hypothetical protein
MLMAIKAVTLPLFSQSQSVKPLGCKFIAEVNLH